jgi:ribonuclease HI
MAAWEAIGGGHLIRCGITPMWKTQREAERVLERERKPCEFRGTQRQTAAYAKILEEEIREGVVVPVQHSYVKWWNSTFLVPKKGGEYRKVLNCKRINALMSPTHFKMEDVRTVKEILTEGDYAVSVDIKSAYSHVSVHPSLRPFLCFLFQGRSYAYVGMPFGLMDAPRVFTKIMRAVMWKIRQRWRIRCVVYLDDLLFLDQDRLHLQETIGEILQFLDSLGWVVNEKKSELVPSQVFRFLGWEWDSTQMSVKLGKEKRNALRILLQQWERKMYRTVKVPVRELAGLIGSLNATRLQFEQASLYLVKLTRLKDSGVQRDGWEARIRLTPMVSGELGWWIKTLKWNVPKSLLQEGRPDAHMWVDASPSGWGAWVQQPHGRVHAFGVWPPNLRDQTSNFKELYAVIMAMRRFATLFSLSQVRHVRLHSDNSAVVYNIRRKAAARNLYPSLRQLLNLIQNLGIHLSVEHVAGVKNETADSLSRLSRSGDYKLKEGVLQEICSTMHVQPRVDLFATRSNTQLPLPLHPRVGMDSIPQDAMSIPWTGGMPFIHPPVPLIGRCLQKILQENVAAVLVIPHWQGQSWSVLLRKMTAQEMVLGKSADLLVPGHQMVEKGDKLPPGCLAAHLLQPPYSI